MKMNISRLKTGKLFIFLFFSVLIIPSCIKDYKDFDGISTDILWKPNVAGAALNTTLTLRDVLQDYDTNELFIEDQTGFLYLMYHKRVFSMPASDLISLPDANFSETFSSTDFTSQGFPGTPSATVTKNLTWFLSMTNSEVLDSLFLKGGNLTVSFNSTFQHTGTLVLSFPSITNILTGTAYTKTINITSPTGSFNFNQTYNDLLGYKIDFTQSVGNNQFPVIAEFTQNSSGNPVNSGDQASLSVSFSNLQFNYLFGDLGQYTIHINPDTVHVEIFNKAFDGFMYFVDPKFRFYIDNSLGLPMSFDFLDFQIYSTSLQGYNTYQFPSAYDPLLVSAPIIPGQVSQTVLLLDTNNFTTIRDIVADNPKYVYFGVDALTNPTGTSQYNFASDTSRFSVDLEVELPMWGRADYFVLQDSLDFDFENSIGDSIQYDSLMVEYVLFRLNVNNGMPVDAYVQVYFTDSNYVVLDSLFDQPMQQIVTSGILGQTGKVVQSTNKQTDIVYRGERIEHLRPSKYALVRGYIKTTNNAQTNVRFYAEYALNIRLGVQVQGNINVYDLD